jgi:hypothetical protein
MRFLTTKYLVPFLILCMVSVASCVQSTSVVPSAGIGESPLTATSPLLKPEEPEADETGMSPTRTPLPQPSQDRGAVTGRVMNATIDQPLSTIAVYLGDVASMGEGKGNIVTIKEKRSFHTLTDTEGYFAITGVEPGTYALVLWTPRNSVVVEDPEDSGDYFLFSIERGQITELGEFASDIP